MVDDEGYYPEDKPYLDIMSRCCYKTEQTAWHKKNNIKRHIHTRKKGGPGPSPIRKSPTRKISPPKAKISKLIEIKNTTPKDDLKLSKSLSRTITASPPRTTELKSFTPEIKPLLQKPSTKMEKYDIMSNIMTPIIAKLSPSDRNPFDPKEDIAYDLAEEQIQKIYDNPTITLKNGKIVKYNSKNSESTFNKFI